MALGWVLHLVHKPPGAVGFRVVPERRVLPRRWIAERTSAWTTQSRRHGKDYEALPAVSEAMPQASMIALMLRRLA